jgi:hypothetical protein
VRLSGNGSARVEKSRKVATSSHGCIGFAYAMAESRMGVLTTLSPSIGYIGSSKQRPAACEPQVEGGST